MHPNEQNVVSRWSICDRCGITFQNIKDAEKHYIDAHRAKAVTEYLDLVGRTLTKN